MIRQFYRHTILFVVLVLVQVLILNHIQLTGFINPYLYVLFILFLPMGLHRGVLMILGFFLGLVIDMFSNTPGMHAGACVLIGFLRPYVLGFFFPRDVNDADSCPSLQEYGAVAYLKYVVVLVFVHHMFLFFAEQFEHLFFWSTILRIILSTIASVLFIVIAQYFLPVKAERR